MYSNSIIDTNIVNTPQILYNYDKEMINMSYVIMMKCSDGIVCGADSRSTHNDNNYIRSAGNIKKVFSNKNLIVGAFGTNEVIVEYHNNTTKIIKRISIEDILKKIIVSSYSIEEFATNFQNSIINPDKYSFLLGFKDSNDYKIYTLELSKKECIATESKGKILSTVGAEFTYNQVLCNKNITCEKAEKIIRKMIETTEYLQSELLEYQTVAGDIVIETLK